MSITEFLIMDIIAGLAVFCFGIASLVVAYAFYRLAAMIKKQLSVEEKMLIWHLENPPHVRQAKIDAEFEEVMERLRKEHANE